MRFRKKDEKNFVRVGIFIAGLTLVFMIMIVSIGKQNSFFESKVEVKARVSNVSNLKNGSYVELKGIRIGTVKQIEILSDEEVQITLSLLEDHLRWIKQDSRIAISTAGLVGDKFLEIFNGTRESPPFDPEKDILTSEAATDFKSIVTKGESIATLAERILTRVDTILYNMNDGKKLIETVNSIHKASSNLEKITQELREARLAHTVGNVNMSMEKLNKAAVSVEKIMSRIEEGPGTMNSLIFDDGLHDDLRALLGGAQRNKVIKYFIRESIKNSERQKSKADD